MVAFTAASVLTASALNSAFNAYTVNAQTGTTYTFVLTDQGGLVTASNASASTYTVPANATVAYATGTRIELLNIGAGTVTLSPAGGVTLTGTTIVPQNGRVVLVKQATNTWYSNPLGGGGLSFIASSAFSAATSVSVNNCFTTAFDSYRIVVDATASTSVLVAIRLRASGADDTTANYAGQRANIAGTTLTASSSSAATSVGVIGIGTGRCSGYIDITGPRLSQHTSGFAVSQYGGTVTWESNAFLHSVASPFDGFSLIMSSGNMTGTLRVYGYQN
jgi:hypothetical protein